MMNQIRQTLRTHDERCICHIVKSIRADSRFCSVPRNTFATMKSATGNVRCNWQLNEKLCLSARITIFHFFFFLLRRTLHWIFTPRVRNCPFSDLHPDFRRRAIDFSRSFSLLIGYANYSRRVFEFVHKYLVLISFAQRFLRQEIFYDIVCTLLHFLSKPQRNRHRARLKGVVCLAAYLVRRKVRHDAGEDSFSSHWDRHVCYWRAEARSL